MSRGKVGGVATFIAGGAYLFVLISTIWGHGQPSAPWILVAALAAGAFLSIGVLAALFRPESWLSLPALFSAPALLMAMFYIRDWGGQMTLVLIAGATFLVGVAACGAVRVVLAVRNQHRDAH
jgi:hypothetical protein